jgi:hypothetical protein
MEIDPTTPESRWHERVPTPLVVGAAATALGFELSPLNESVRGTVAFGTLDLIKSQYDFVAAAGTVGAITFTVEMGTAGFAAWGLERGSDKLDKTAAFLSRLFRKKSKEEEVKQDIPADSEQANSFARRMITHGSLGMGVGSALVVTAEHVKNRQRTLRDNLQTGFESATFVAAWSAVIGGLVTGGSEALGKLNAEVEVVGHEISAKGLSEEIVTYAPNPLVWMSIFGGLLSLGWMSDAYKKTDRHQAAVLRRQMRAIPSQDPRDPRAPKKALKLMQS